MPVAPLSFNPAFRSSGFTPFNAFEGSMVGGGPTGGLLTMLLQSVASGFMHDQGLMAFGFTQQNLHQRMMAMRSHQQHQELVQRMAQHDQQTFFQSFRGLAQLAGTPWGMEQQQAAQSLAGSAVGFAPLMTMLAPDFLDEMAGRRGSAAVMASRMFSGARFRIDPLSGQMGMSEDSIRTMTDETFTNLLAGSAWRRQAGLSAGQLGQAFAELQRMGMVAGGRVGTRDLDPELLVDAAVRNHLDLGLGAGYDPRWAGIAAADVDFSKLGGRDLQTLMSDRQVAGAVRSFDAQRVTRTLEQYQGVVQSLREVFGANGEADAPLPRLLETLQQLSGNGLQQVEPARLEQLVRTTHNLASMGGVNLAGTLMLNQFSTAMAGQLGLSSLVAPELTQHMLAFGTGLQGQGVLGHRAFGLSNLDELRLQAGQLAASAARSPLANRLGAALRLQEAMGPGMLDPDSEAAQYLASVRAGHLPSVLDEEQFTRMLVEGSGGRLTAGMLQDAFQQTAANAEMGVRFGLATTVRRGMRAEVMDYLGRNLEFTTFQQLSGTLGTGRGRGLGVELSRSFIDTLGGMGASTRTSRDHRNRRLAAAMQQRVRELAASGNQEAADLLAAHGPDPVFWAGLAETMFGQAEAASRDPLNPFGARSLQDTLVQFDTQVLDQAQRSQAQAMTQAAFQRALAPLGSNSMLRSAVQAVIDADDRTGLAGVFAQSMGGINVDDISEGLTAELQALRAAQTELDTASKAVLAATSPSERAAAQATLDSRAQGMQDATRKLSDFLERNGYYLGSTVNRRQAARLGDAHRFSSGLLEGLRRGQLQGEDLVFLGDADQTRLNEVAAALGMDPGQLVLADRATLNEAVAAGTITAADATFVRGAGNRVRDRFDQALARERGGSQDLVAQALTDPRLLSRLGPGGLDTLRDLDQHTRTLDELAARYAGGDLAALLRGELTASVTPQEQGRIMAQADQARYEREAAARRFHRMLQPSHRGYGHLADIDAVDAIARKLAGMDDLTVSVRTAHDLLTITDADLAELQAHLSPEQWQALQRARQQQQAVDKDIEQFRQDTLKSPEDVIREGFGNLGLTTDEEIKAAVGGDAAYQELLAEAGKTGEVDVRRRAGFLAMTRDIARQRELAGRTDLTASEQQELESLQRLTSGYDAQLRQLGTDEGYDLGSEDFVTAYREIASKASPGGGSEDINVRITGGSITLNDDGTVDLDLQGAGSRGGI